METHLTLRLPKDLARTLARWAKKRGIPKSALVREAVAKYLAPAEPPEGGRGSVTGRELAARWRTVPHLTPREADDLAADIVAGRSALPPLAPPWE